MSNMNPHKSFTPLHQQQHLGWWEVPLHGLNNVLFADASLYWNGRAQVCCWWRVYWLIWCVKCDGLSQNRITYEGKSCFCCWWPGTLHIFRYRYSVILCITMSTEVIYNLWSMPMIDTQCIDFLLTFVYTHCIDICLHFCPWA